MEQVLGFIVDLFIGHGVIIAVGAFVLAQIAKEVVGEKSYRYIPLACGLFGALFGLFVPGIFEETQGAIRAVMGLALGWAATGGYETIAQFKKGQIEEAI